MVVVTDDPVRDVEIVLREIYADTEMALLANVDACKAIGSRYNISPKTARHWITKAVRAGRALQFPPYGKTRKITVPGVRSTGPTYLGGLPSAPAPGSVPLYPVLREDQRTPDGGLGSMIMVITPAACARLAAQIDRLTVLPEAIDMRISLGADARLEIPDLTAPNVEDFLRLGTIALRTAREEHDA